MKCQKCHNQAILHITEVLGEEQFEELHLCEQCAQKYLYESQQKAGKAAIAESGREEAGLFNQHECPSCGIKFVEFRNTGRLGGPNAYQEFRDDLTPLLESTQGETNHGGKAPRRMPKSQQALSELMQLRNRLKQAATKEDYEEAARLRDRIKQLEETGAVSGQ